LNSTFWIIYDALAAEQVSRYKHDNATESLLLLF
jgi:hypothetical protein